MAATVPCTRHGGQLGQGEWLVAGGGLLLHPAHHTATATHPAEETFCTLLLLLLSRLLTKTAAEM